MNFCLLCFNMFILINLFVYLYYKSAHVCRSCLLSFPHPSNLELHKDKDCVYNETNLQHLASPHVSINIRAMLLGNEPHNSNICIFFHLLGLPDETWLSSLVKGS